MAVCTGTLINCVDYLSLAHICQWVVQEVRDIGVGRCMVVHGCREALPGLGKGIYTYLKAVLLNSREVADFKHTTFLTSSSVLPHDSSNLDYL